MKNSIIRNLILLIILYSLALGQNSANEPGGRNQNQLESTLEHYRDSGDSLKLAAAEFLISNMNGHAYAVFALKDSAGNVVPFDATTFTDFDTLEAAFDSLEEKYGTLDFKRDTLIYDTSAITDGYLITHIEESFRTWRECPWARDYSFEDFCEYILPYRGSNEPLELWRDYFRDKYRDLKTRMVDSMSALEAAAFINADVRSWFGFDRRYYYHPTDQGLAEMLKSGLGRCEDMTNISTYALRANGLGVTSDYTPYWANAGNNHAWNVLVLPDSRAIPFMGAEADPGKYALNWKAAKVYRKMFSKQKNNLVFRERKQEKIPGWLAGENYKDVTAAYGPVADFAVRLDKPAPDSIDIAYICVFNSGEWKPIDWGKIEDDNVTFKNMATGVVYIPGLYVNEKMETWGFPLILERDGTIRYLEVAEVAKIDVVLDAITVIKPDLSTDGVRTAGLVAGSEYELFYWQAGWQSLGKTPARDSLATFPGVPAGALYRLLGADLDDEERIFTYENGRQVWW